MNRNEIVPQTICQIDLNGVNRMLYVKIIIVVMLFLSE